MPRARWFLVGSLLVVAAAGWLLEARGPFGAHPAITYEEFLADFQAGGVVQIVQWREQLEVTEGSLLLSVTIPPDRDLPADLAQARVDGGVPYAYSRLPDRWLGLLTPWIPAALAVTALLIWVTAVLGDRRWASRSGPAGGPQAPS